MARFTVLIHPEPDGGYSIASPGLHLVTQVDTVDHALAMAREAAESAIQGLVEQHDVVVPELAPPIIASIEVEIPDAISAYVDDTVPVADWA